MSRELSPQTEQYLESVVAAGVFPSKEAAIEAAVEALREKDDELIPFVPDEHMEMVEQALESVEAGRARPFTEADWERFRKAARDSASGNSSEAI